MLAAWGITDAFLCILNESDTLYVIARFQSIIYTQSGITILNIFYKYMGRKVDLLFRYTLFICLFLAQAGILTPWMVEDVRMSSWGTTPVPGPLYYPGALFSTILPVSIGIYYLVRHYLSISEEIERTPTRIVFIGMIVALAISWIFDVALPVFFNIEFPQQTHVAGVILMAFLFYAIHRYRLLTIDIPDVARELFSNAHEGVLLIKNRAIKDMNQVAEILLQPYVTYSKEDTVLDFLKKCRQTGKTEVEVVSEQSGSTYALSVSIIDIKNRFTGDAVLMFIRDVSQRVHNEQQIKQINTDLKQARDQAIEASLAKSQFLAGMSHELRTPLNAVIGFSSLALEKTKGGCDIEFKDELQEIYSAGNHLLELINSLLDISKIEARKYDLYIERFDMKELINSTVSTSRPLAEKNGNQIVVEIGNDVGDMNSDQTKVRQVLYNLISNASKFTEQGKISIECRRVSNRRDYYRIIVNDTGIGMSDEQLERLFVAYQQADATIAHKYGGTGLGLMLTQKICQMLGGDISVESEPGVGSTFTVLLPVESDTADNAKA
jgi:signal transduction histidine kinase